jgi:hypothetical protein
VLGAATTVGLALAAAAAASERLVRDWWWQVTEGRMWGAGV